MNDILEVFTGAINAVLHYKKTLFKSLLIPFIALILLQFTGVTPVEDSITLFIFISLLSVLLQTIIAVTTHRIILLGEKSVPEWGRFPSSNELKFILYGIGMGLLMIPAGLLSQMPTIGVPISIAIIVYLLARLSLIFPAIATGQNWSFTDSWENTKDHKVLMIVTVTIFPIIFGIPEYLLSHLPYSQIPVAILSALMTIFVVAALSTAFKLIHGDTEIEDENDEGEYHPIPPMNSKNPYN